MEQLNPDPGRKMKTENSTDFASALPITEEDIEEYPIGLRRYAICFILGFNIVLPMLDISILSTALPALTDEFHSLQDVGWYGSAYLMACATLLLPCGKAYTIFSPIACFLWSIVIFEIGSIISATAQSSNVLILGRAIAGAGDSGIWAGTLCMIAYGFPLRLRPAVNGAMGILTASATALGPPLGGVFITKASWRWCFAINPIIGAPTFIAAFFILRDLKFPEQKQEGFWSKVRRFDWLGIAVHFPGIICLLLAMQWGGTRFAWANEKIIALFIVSGLLLSAFVGVQWWKKEEAMLSLRILKQRSVAAGAAYCFAIVASGERISYYAPTWFQAIKGVNALQSGVMILPLTAATGVAGIAAGTLITYLGHYVPFMIVGSVSVLVGAVLTTQFQPDSGPGIWVTAIILVGLGIGLGFEQPQVAAQTVLTIEDIPIGMSVVIFAQTLGQAIFISVVGSVINNEILSGFKASLPGVDLGDVLDKGATELQNVLPAADVGLVKQIYNTAITRTFYICVAMAGVSLVAACLMEWKSVKDEVVVEPEGERVREGVAVGIEVKSES